MKHPKKEKKTNGKLGILVGGGPAPGINGVISASVIEAERNGINCTGFYEGFEGISLSKNPERIELVTRHLETGESSKEVSRVDVEGGSILRTSRHNPSDKELDRAIKTLIELEIKYLITIGGDDTASSASRLADRAKGKIRVAHVPKTIDNDLPLPGDMPTFGYRTACELGAKLVRNLMVDAATMPRWFIVVTMGRTAGHLALGIGKAAGATLTIIPEDPEFGNSQNKISASLVCDIIESSIYKRLTLGRQDGVVVISEGVVLKLLKGEIEKLTGKTFLYDLHGHVKLGEFDMAPIWKSEIDKRLKRLKEKFNIAITTTAQNIGYPLRCQTPGSFDREYIRELGFAAVRFVLGKTPYKNISKINSAMVYIEHGNMRYSNFADIRKIDPKTGKLRVQVRLVNINTQSYKVAREYMIRLEESDFTDESKLNSLAEVSKMSTKEFKKKFLHLVANDSLYNI
ncbi:MAG: 6-phosphofructokinase [Bacteroidetes bacterium]|nr:6-phosphofructokinase [Bacteroidota bacterium]